MSIAATETHERTLAQRRKDALDFIREHCPDHDPHWDRIYLHVNGLGRVSYEGELDVGAHRIKHEYWWFDGPLTDELVARLDQNAADHLEVMIVVGHRNGDLTYLDPDRGEIEGSWTIILSDNPGTAILDALDGLEQCEKSPFYKADTIELAGAQIAGRMGLPWERRPDADPSYPIFHKLVAISNFRNGDWHGGLGDWLDAGLPHVRGDLIRKYMKERFPRLPDCDSEYDEWKRTLRQAAKHLEFLWADDGDASPDERKVAT